MKMTTAQAIALGEYLSEWPDDLTYRQIIEAMNDDDSPLHEHILTCEYFEDWYYAALAERIEGLRIAIDKALLDLIVERESVL